MSRPMRRVVTGHDAHGKSVIVMDGPSPHVLELEGMPGLALINLWVTDRAPAANAGSADAAKLMARANASEADNEPAYESRSQDEDTRCSRS